MKASRMLFSEKPLPAQSAAASGGDDVVTMTSSDLIPASTSRDSSVAASYADKHLTHRAVTLAVLNVYDITCAITMSHAFIMLQSINQSINQSIVVNIAQRYNKFPMRSSVVLIRPNTEQTEKF